MSGAAMALALALLVGPTTARRRLEAVKLIAPVRRRIPMLSCAMAAGLALAVVVPVGVVAAGGVVVATASFRWRRRIVQRCRSAESIALQGALETLVGELRVGAHPVAALEVAATEVDGSVSTALREVAARARLGADVSAGLRSVARRSPLAAHWERIAVCWDLAQAHGLGIATLIQTAHRDIVERERFSARVSAGMAGARATAAVLAGLPVLGVGLGQLIGADPVSFLLGGAGGWLLVVGVTLACAGLLWSDRITGRVLT